MGRIGEKSKFCLINFLACYHFRRLSSMFPRDFFFFLSVCHQIFKIFIVFSLAEEKRRREKAA